MGERIPSPPTESGTDCPACTPGRWPVNGTPKYIYCYFWGIVDCGWSSHAAPNGEVFKLDQDPANPCHWLLLGAAWHVDWWAKMLAPLLSRITLKDHHGFSFFYGQSLGCPPENWRYSNIQATCILMYAGSAGYASVWWNDDLADLIVEFGLVAGRQLFYERRKAATSGYVHKFCDTRQRTNVKFHHS